MPSVPSVSYRDPAPSLVSPRSAPSPVAPLAARERELAALAGRQSSVVAMYQCLELGLGKDWVYTRVRRGQWRRIHRGVFVTHAGAPVWRTRAWAALLYYGPQALLSHRAAAFEHEIVGTPPRVVEVVLPHGVQVRQAPGTRVYRRRAMPPGQGLLRRTWAEETVLDLVDQAADVDEMIGWLCDAARARIYPEQIRAAAARRSRLRRRRLVEEMLAEVDLGIESPLERRYHHDVERAHGMPRGRLQVREVVEGRWIRADRVYDEYATRVELDGQLAHPGGATDRDVMRDNAVRLVRDQVTLRYRWRHVARMACQVAHQVGASLQRGGWRGAPRGCGPECVVDGAAPRSG